MSRFRTITPLLVLPLLLVAMPGAANPTLPSPIEIKAATVVARGAAIANAPSAAAAPLLVTPDPTTLPAGAAPRLPYFNVAAETIFDGTKRIDTYGLQGTVTHLHKVDGGYVLGRRIGDRSGLAFVTTTGARHALTSDWHWPSDNGIYRGVMVARAGDRIVFNTAERTNPRTYRDTVVMSVPSGRILERRTFSSLPLLLGFSNDRVLMGVDVRILWWTPGTFRTTLLADGATSMSADMSALQYVHRERATSDFRVASIPPRTTPSWPIPVEDIQYGYWSTDDLRLAGTSEVTDGTDHVESFLVARASDGEYLMFVRVPAVPQITWEDNLTVLMMTYTHTVNGVFRLIRCTLSGACERVGPASSTKYGPYVVANRRNS